MRDETPDSKPKLCFSPTDYFKEIVQSGLSDRKMQTFPMAESYLVGLLEHYVHANHLFDEPGTPGEKKTRQTLAELYLTATSDPNGVRVDLMKRLADSSLYISGFFGDSLNRQLVDIDYYADMGGVAYRSLANHSREDTVRQVYREYALRFLEFVEVLTSISQRVLVQSNLDVLRLYERYIRTGSELAREQLAERGLVTPPHNEIKKVSQ